MAQLVAELQTKAEELSKQGDFLQAAEIWQEIIENRPESAEAHLNQGVAFFRANDLEKSLKAFNSAIALNKEMFGAYFNKGKILARLGKFGDAATTFETALRLKNDPRIYEVLAQAYNQLSKYDDALKTAALGIAALAGNPDSLETLHNARIFAFFKLDRPIDALEDVEAVLKLKDWDQLRKEQVGLYTAVLGFKGHDLMKKNNFAEAEGYFKRALDVEKTSQRQAAYGICLAQTMNLTSALPVLLEAYAMDSTNPMILKALGLVTTELKQYDKGAKYFEELFVDEKQKLDTDMCMGYAVCLVQLDREDEALNPLEFVYANDKSNWVGSGILGALYLKRDRNEEAVDVLKSAIDNSNGQADDAIYYNYAIALLRLQQLEESLEAFQTAHKLNPQNTAAEQAITTIKKELEEQEKERVEAEKEQARQIAEQKKAEAEQQETARKELEKQQASAKELEKQQAGVKGSGKAGLTDQYFEKGGPNFKINKVPGAFERGRGKRQGTRIAVLTGQLAPQVSTSKYNRRKSLEAIPKGITSNGANSYANWFNKEVLGGDDDE